MNNITWTEIVAAIGAVIIIARIIVKLTPTPKDDSFLEKVVAFLKHIGLHISLFVALAALTTGCARFSTNQIERRYDPDSGKLTAEISTRASSGTFFESKSTLAKWKAVQSEKSQSAEVGGLSQESSGTNVVNALTGIAEILKLVRPAP